MRRRRPTYPLPLLLATLLACFASQARAEVKLPALFSDHMVLQRDLPVPVWGWADAGESVTVSVGSQSKTASPNADGLWRVTLDPLKSGGPLTVTVKGKNTVTLQDVLIGEVWLCSGQSNMAWRVSQARDFESEKAAANFPQIRMFRVQAAPSQQIQNDCKGTWAACTPETVGGFSATAYFFGRTLHEKLGVPIGLINSSVGGTAIEAWTSMDAQRDLSELKPTLADWEKRDAGYEPEKAQALNSKRVAQWKEAVAKAKSEGKTPPPRPALLFDPRTNANHPANLFNSMIAPLVGYAIRGAIWYQGESNAGNGARAALYRLQLPLMIRDWRRRWGEGDFPFLWVQLPNFRQRSKDPGTSSAWAVIREAMLQSLKVPNTGMAVTIDVGEANDIHPKNKQDVGKRLALVALVDVYHQKGPGRSPLPESHSVRSGEIVLTFKHADGGLEATRGEELKGFAIAGSDHKWHWAKARIEGDKVIVSAAEVKEPTAVRYAWADNPEANLVNGAGLPASPFRTDDWSDALPAKK